MASLLQTQREFRQRLLASDRAAAQEMIRVYADVYAAIEDDLASLTRRISAARAAGTPITQSWLFQEQRYRSLLQQADSAYRYASSTASGTVTSTQSQAVQLGAEAAEALTRSLVPPQIALSWSQLPTGAIESFVGFASDGSPLSALFDRLGPEASRGIRSSLLRGIGLGYSPRRIAAGMRDTVGISLTRALTISRTEVLRAYRQSQSDGYRANKDVVKAKVWHSALDNRSCVVCISQHGSVWPLDAIMETHPNCRCSWIPVTKTWAELGYEGIEDTNAKIERGTDWFAQLPAERQAAMLGKGRFAAYQNGVGLSDMIGRRTDRRWGKVAFIRPMRDLPAKLVAGSADYPLADLARAFPEHAAHPVSGWAEPFNHVTLKSGMKVDLSPYGDAVPGGYNGGWAMYENATGKKMGFLDYQSGGDTVTIGLIEVSSAFRGSGASDALLSRLIAEFPGKRIDPGLLTDDGFKWWRRVSKIAQVEKVAA